ncbi:MAG TPA: TIM-barrel domain-containing protein [Fluviicoccus sp.]|nr:TIM-barrel domain-containing protein [Fluviicoccus sp.]
MGIFGNFLKSVTSPLSTTAKTVAYAVGGGAVIGALAVGELVSIPVDAAAKALSALPQIPGRLASFAGLDQPPAATGGHVVGQARFQVLSPGLIRLEYAEDNRFEDRPTMLAYNRQIAPPPYTVSDDGKVFRITTSRLTLTYLKDSGPFTDRNLTITLNSDSGQIRATPQWRSGRYTPNPLDWGLPGYLKNVSAAQNNAPRTSGNLGGWYRSLDSQSDAVPLHDGLLSRDGYHFIDDSQSAVIAGPDKYESRPFHTATWKPGYFLGKARDVLTTKPGEAPGAEPPLAGDYQDGYLFAYGSDYKAALQDYRTLSGAVPLLPRKAFGVWFSRYYPYSDAEFRNVLFPAFRRERVPLDVLGIDTDAKAPVAWNGWQWNTALLPDAKGTIRWMHEQGVDVFLNTHPSISAIDPKLPATLQTVGPDTLRGGAAASFFQWGTGLLDGSRQKFENITGIPFVFDFAKPSHLQAYMNLHDDFDRDGIDGYWLDWCCDDSSVGGQINRGEFSPDNWINQQYARRNQARGSRWLPLARSGGSFQDWHGNRPGPWGSQRSTIHFTGDTVATWPMLDFQARFAAAEGSIGMSYVSHDIGGFQTGVLIDTNQPYDEELYVRWIQLAAFQPILRLHSSSKSGSQRLPWEFQGKTRTVSAEFLRLRGALVPYLYTIAREAHDTGLPMTRAMYLDWPNQEAAYRYDRQYMLGSQLLVVPIGAPADKQTGLAGKKVWFPPEGPWVDIFTGEVYAGGTEVTVQTPLERMPVFARAGSILPLAPYMDFSEQQPLDNLKLTVFPGKDGEFSLYEDDGSGLGYQQGAFARTRFAFSNRLMQLDISTTGSFAKQVGQRAYQIKVVRVAQPAAVWLSGSALPPLASPPDGTTPGWFYDSGSQTLHIQTDKRNTREAQSVVFR